MRIVKIARICEAWSQMVEDTENLGHQLQPMQFAGGPDLLAAKPNCRKFQDTFFSDFYFQFQNIMIPGIINFLGELCPKRKTSLLCNVSKWSSDNWLQSSKCPNFILCEKKSQKRPTTKELSFNKKERTSFTWTYPIVHICFPSERHIPQIK